MTHEELATGWLRNNGWNFVRVGISNCGLSTYCKIDALTVRVSNRGYFIGDDYTRWEEGGLPEFKAVMKARGGQ